MKKRIKLLLSLSLVVVLCFVLFAACDPAKNPTTYKVTYVAGDANATGTAPTEKDHAEGEKFKVAKNTFTLTGKTFKGWKFGDKVYQPDADFEMPASEVTFTATWSEVYTLTFGKGAATGETVTGDDIEVKSYEKDAKVTLPIPEWTNGTKVFDCWTDGTTDYAGGSEYTMPGANTTLTAKWTQGYSVTYRFNKFDVMPEDDEDANADDYVKGTLPAVKYYKAGAEVTIADVTGITYSEHTFKGWKFVGPVDSPADDIAPAAADATETLYQPNGKYTMTAENVIFEAVFEINKYTITIDLNGAKLNDGATLPTLEDHAKGEQFYLPYNYAIENVATKTGYRVAGFSDGSTDENGNEILFKYGTYYTMPGNNVTLKVVWKQEHSVIFKAGSSVTGVEDIIYDKKYIEGTSIYLANFKNIMTGTTGKKRIGWSLTDGGDAIEESSITMTDSDLILYAVWATAYNVAYENGGTTGITGTAPTDSNAYVAKDRITLAANPFTFTGHIFAGWKIKDATDEKLYIPGSQYTVPDDINANITFVAVWADLIKAGTWKTASTSDQKTLVVDIGTKYDAAAYSNKTSIDETKICIDYDNKHVTLSYKETTKVWEGTEGTTTYALSIAENKLTLKTKNGSAAEVSTEFTTHDETTDVPNELLGEWIASSDAYVITKTADGKINVKVNSNAVSDYERYNTDRYVYAWKGSYTKPGMYPGEEPTEHNLIIVYTKVNIDNDNVDYNVVIVDTYDRGNNNIITNYFNCNSHVSQEMINEIATYEGAWDSTGDDAVKYTLSVAKTARAATMTVTFTTKAADATKEDEVLTLTFAKTNGAWTATRQETIESEDEEDTTTVTTTYTLALSDNTLTLKSKKDNEAEKTITFAKHQQGDVTAADLVGTWNYTNMPNGAILEITADGENLTVTYSTRTIAGKTEKFKNQKFTKTTDGWTATVDGTAYVLTYDSTANTISFKVGDAAPLTFTKSTSSGGGSSGDTQPDEPMSLTVK